MIKILLLTIFLAVKSLYIPLNRRKPKYYWKLKVDDRIPFVPIFIILYLGYFIWILMTVILLWNTKYIFDFFTTYITSYIIGGAFWYFYPNGVRRPLIKNKDLFSRITMFIYSTDEDANGFPSAHIFGTLICSFFVFLVFPDYWLAILVITLLISVSTLLTKQHYIVDILGGMIIFVLSTVISLILIK